MRKSLVISLVVLTLSVFSSSSRAQVSPPKEFITSVTYGVLAGTLMGIASLAFTRNPGDNLNKIARGASLGLYLGIALGLYVTYGVNEEPSEDLAYKLDSKKFKEPDFLVYPILGDMQIEGIGASYKLAEF